MSVVMQARSSESGEMVTWVTASADWTGSEYPGAGSPEDIAVAAKEEPTGGGGGGGGEIDAGDITSGTLALARGGLGTDASAFNGLVSISGGTTSAVTPASGIATFLQTPSGANLAAALTSALPISKGGTGFTTIGSANTVAISTGVGFSWATISNANISASAAIDVSKLGVVSSVATFLQTPSGANLASALTSALPDSKGGTGLTALGSGIATWLGTPSGANLVGALTSQIPGSAISPNFSGNDITCDFLYAITGIQTDAEVYALSGYVSENNYRWASGGATGELQWSPTINRAIDLPDADGTVCLIAATQTLTNKTVDGANNTISNLAASAIASGSLAAARGGLGTDASAFTGVAKWSSGTASAAALVNADVSASAAIAVSKLAAGSAGQTLTMVSSTPTWTTNNAPASVAVAALGIDWSAGQVFTKTLSAGSNTFTFSNATDGQVITVIVTGAASTLTWPTVKWSGGTPPTQTASGTDVYTFVKAGSTIYGSVVQAMS